MAGVWKALGDPTRRAVLDLLARGPHTTGQLAAHFPQTRIAIIQHLAVLRDARLVLSRKRGRERWHYLNAVPLETLRRRWLDPQQGRWARTLHRLKDHVEAKENPVPIDQSEQLAIDIEQEFDIDAPRARVFDAIVKETAAWWRPPYCDPRARALVMDAELGGFLREDWGAGAGAILATLTRFEPSALIELTGPLHMGLVHCVTTLALSDCEEQTHLRFSQRAFGTPDPEVLEHAEAGWKELLGTRLKSRAERTSPPNPRK